MSSAKLNLVLQNNRYRGPMESKKLNDTSKIVQKHYKDLKELKQKVVNARYQMTSCVKTYNQEMHKNT